jgi:hypothetical protein
VIPPFGWWPGFALCGLPAKEGTDEESDTPAGDDGLVS